MPRSTPYGAFNFTVSFNSEDFGGFSDVTGLMTEFTMAEYREGTDPNHSRKVPGVHKAGDVTLKRGIVSSRVLWDWVQAVRTQGPNGKKPEVRVTLYDEARAPVQTWVLRDVTPTKFSGPAFAAKGGGDVAMEELVLASDTIDMEFDQ